MPARTVVQTWPKTTLNRSAGRYPLPLRRSRSVQREFANDAVSLKGFVVERADGTRKFVNVDIPDDLSMMARDAVFDGLQRLLQQGRLVRADAVACGAGGRVLSLDHLK